LGLSVMSLHTVMLEGASGPVAILDVEGFPIMRKWFLVYPKGKELSLVARTFLEFAIDHEPIIRKRMQTMWPALKFVLENKRKTAARKKRAAKK